MKELLFLFMMKNDAPVGLTSLGIKRQQPQKKPDIWEMPDFFKPNCRENDLLKLNVLLKNY